MSDKKITRGGNGYVEKLGDGTSRSVIATPAGTRVTRHRGGESWPENPQAIHIESVAGSVVGGGNPRVTVKKTGGETVDLTRRAGGSLDEQVHRDGFTKPK